MRISNHSTVGIRMPLSLVEDIHARKGNCSYAKQTRAKGLELGQPISSIAAKKEESKQKKKI